MVLKRVILLLLVMAVSGCNPFGTEVGKLKNIEITVSGGVRPVISWKGGAVSYVAVDMTTTPLPIDARFGTVWGYRTVNDLGDDTDGITSPVQFGSVVSLATDISESMCRIDSLIPGVTYKISMSTAGPISYGSVYYTPQQ